MLPVLQYGPIVRYTSGDLSYGLSIRPIMLPSQAVLGRGIPLVLGIWDYPPAWGLGASTVGASTGERKLDVTRALNARD